MEIYLNSNFGIEKITDDLAEKLIKGSTDFDLLKIYIPTTLKNSFTTIYPLYSVKRADGRELGPYATITTADTSVTNYYGWKGYFNARDIAVEGALEITLTFFINDSIKKTVAKVTTNVAQAVVVDDDIYMLNDSQIYESLLASVNHLATYAYSFANEVVQSYSDLAGITATNEQYRVVVLNDSNYDNNPSMYQWNGSSWDFKGYFDWTQYLDDKFDAYQTTLEAAIDQRLDNQDATIAGLGQLHPSGVDTSTNILAKASDDGIWIGSDTGNWYYWDANSSQYVSGGVYQTAVNYDELEEDLEFVKYQAKNIDGNYYPKIVAGAIVNGIDNDDAWYLTHNGRTPDIYKWEKTISVTAPSGTTFFIVAYDENEDFLATSSGQTGTFNFTTTIFNPQPSYFRISFRNTDSSIIEDGLFHKIFFSNTNNIVNDISNLKEKDVEIDNKINNINQIEVATDISEDGIEFETIYKSQKRKYIGKNIIAINHDDLTSQDYVDTRKIYNKYEFNANFNFILKPFADTTEMKNMIENVKKLVNDGNDLGLHAICGSSFWWMNKLYDFRPNYSSTFAPTLSEVSTDTGNGKNVFGFPIDATKKFNDVGFKDIPSTYTEVLVQSATSTQYLTLLNYYAFYHTNLRLTGLDLNGVSRNWTATYWLEYWYNELIDDTLGYSSSTWFGEYDYPSGENINDYYPDLEHLKNGKMVFYDDTSNPNYNNNDYQKVGRFNSGLFKGCASCCNYEVEERCIQIAKAFCKYYFNIDKFTNFGRHGVRYVDCIWYDGVTPYDNREKTILSGEVGKVYMSLKQKFMTQHDILLENGIKMTNHYTPLEPIYESQIGLYYGQDGVRYPFFNHTSRELGNTTFLNLFDTASTYTTSIISYENCMKLLDGVDDVIAFAYENAGKQVTSKDGTVTLYVTIYIKTIIDAIRACKGTGKIPVLSIDTIKNDASSDIAINEFLKWCYNNDYYVVPMEYARSEAVKNAREYKQNYFPNPTFKQSLILEYGDVFTSSDALIPDGFAKTNGAYYGSTVDYEVTTENNSKVFTMKAKRNGYTYIQSRMYGLPTGNYTLSFKAKVSDSGTGHIFLTPKKNSDAIKISFSQMQNHIVATTSWNTYSVNITIPENVVNADDGSVGYSYAKGYEDNISNLLFTIGLSLNNVADSNYEYELSISDVKLERN